MKDDLARAYNEASAYFVDLVGRVPRDRYDDPGLGEWKVLELIAHTNRSHSLLVDYTEQPLAPAGPDYNMPQAIAGRALASIAALGDDPPAAVAAAAQRAQDLVADADAHAELETPFGPRRLVDYLPIRVAELVVHGLDITRAVRCDVALPPNALRLTLHLIADMVDKSGAGADVVLALAGRTSLPQGFSVY